MNKNKFSGFTLIELLVVIAIISLISAVVLASVGNIRKKSRDAKRLADIKQIQNALELYLNAYNQYPDSSDVDCTANGTNWDTGYYGAGDTFVSALETAQTISKTPGDPLYSVQCGGYRYYRYAAGSNGCDVSRGPYYVLGIADMETVSGTHPSSPGFSCSSRNWQTEFEWVMGRYQAF